MSYMIVYDNLNSCRTHCIHRTLPIAVNIFSANTWSIPIASRDTFTTNLRFNVLRTCTQFFVSTWSQLREDISPQFIAQLFAAELSTERQQLSVLTYEGSPRLGELRELTPCDLYHERLVCSLLGVHAYTDWLNRNNMSTDQQNSRETFIPGTYATLGSKNRQFIQLLFHASFSSTLSWENKKYFRVWPKNIELYLHIQVPNVISQCAK